MPDTDYSHYIVDSDPAQSSGQMTTSMVKVVRPPSALACRRKEKNRAIVVKVADANKALIPRK